MSDYMKEAERLIDNIATTAFANALGEMPSTRHKEARAALLAHIQRGAVPEGWRDDVDLAAQMLTWADYDGGLTDQQDREIRAHQKKIFAMLAAAPAPSCAAPAPAEVPMPEPVARMLEWRGRLALSPQPSARTFDEFPTSETFPAKKDAYWSDGKLLVLADEARTYGDAREAAGYARGRAEAPKIQWASCPETGTPCSRCPTNQTQCHALAAPAEVLMPKPVAYGFGNTAITGHTNRLMMVRLDVPLDDQYAGVFWHPLVLADEAHTYGVACRAAGEAAGYARGLRDAVRDADIEALRLYVRALCKAVDAATDFAGTVAGGASWWDDVWADHAAALDRARERISQAALRGDVK